MAIIHVYGRFLSLYVFLLIILPPASSIADSEALLKLKESLTNATALDSWKPGTEPCTEKARWVGVLCEKGAVGGLRLGNMGLSGKISIDALVSISGLRSASFMFNAFSGPIPDFNRVGALRGLYISGNKFSGEIPSDYFSKMEGLKKVWFSRNNFSGPIPSSLAGLPQLIDLHLENNHFSGKIPPLQQKTLVSLNLTNNDLEGEIPDSLSRFGANSFDGNPGLCGGNSGWTCNSPPAPSQDHTKDPSSYSKKVMAYWVLVACVVILLLMVAGISTMRRRGETYCVQIHNNLDPPDSLGRIDMESVKKGGSTRSGSSRKGASHVKRNGDLVVINHEKGEFGMSDLMKAAAEVLGNGALGPSYKAIMASGLTVVVKRIREMMGMGMGMGKDKFDLEIRRMGSLSHKNILPPLAYHYRKDEKLLIYEYQHKGSLLFLLHGDRGILHSELNWPVRRKIIQGTARGLDYLHEQLTDLDLPHGNLKSSNILLSSDYEPLLSDYGFCSFITPTQAAQALTAYKSPEAQLHNLISPQSDVFCLGVIILEILTGKFPSQYVNNGQGGTDLVQWVRSAIAEEREAELLDPDIGNAASFGGEMAQLLGIGAACTESNPDQRLELREAIRRIEAVAADGRGGGGGGGDRNARTFEVLPSLRDGYADPPPVASNSWRRHDSVGDQSGRKSFTFEMS